MNHKIKYGVKIIILSLHYIFSLIFLDPFLGGHGGWNTKHIIYFGVIAAYEL